MIDLCGLDNTAKDTSSICKPDLLKITGKRRSFMARLMPNSTSNMKMCLDNIIGGLTKADPIRGKIFITAEQKIII